MVRARGIPCPLCNGRERLVPLAYGAIDGCPRVTLTTWAFVPVRVPIAPTVAQFVVTGGYVSRHAGVSGASGTAFWASEGHDFTTLQPVNP